MENAFSGGTLSNHDRTLLKKIENFYDSAVGLMGGEPYIFNEFGVQIADPDTLKDDAGSLSGARQNIFSASKTVKKEH
ncbi:MAG TPA: hypothetical protein VFW78_10325 [Bacteroidia bacterium]|nr:hypothetical protein [Bacteroidia bacterium]